MIGKSGGDQRFSKPAAKSEDDEWIVTFADMTALLLTFFILLVAISKIDPVLYEQVQASMTKGISDRKVETPLENLKQMLEETVKSMQIEENASIGQDSRGLMLELDAAPFFAPGSADLTPAAQPVLEALALTLSGDNYKGFLIEVQGHTDDLPISSPIYPSNWELSGARAARVVRFLETKGIFPARMRAVGLADTAPKAPNRDPSGVPLPANQEINRRVTIRIFPR